MEDEACISCAGTQAQFSGIMDLKKLLEPEEE